ncbi:hypothetical protein [Flavobacterium terrisoli]|uniref:hypothetical protein n=1 Tax=Flavobacterium terrisoli TaxID=3242195 RepID=UPI0025435934|nr:hypothetical protein [Flavobacterium buctense]
MLRENEQLFTTEELQEIQNNAADNFDFYWNTVVMDGKATEKTIETISKHNHLIFVIGNADTGFKHLNERHSYFSFQNFWVKKDETEFKLDNPTKFHPKMMPIIDYVKIADAIFCSENKNITKNHSPHLFDKYTGEYLYENGSQEKYHLITYKDTKIVHTMFPDKKKHNQKIRFKYGKGIATTKLKYMPSNAYNDLLVPYENKDKVVAYSILLRKFYNEKIERFIIQKHDKEGNPETHYILGEREFEDFESFSRETLHLFQTSDLGELEDIMAQIEKNEE